METQAPPTQFCARPSDGGLDAALTFCRMLTASAAGLAFQLDVSGLDLIDLPPMVGSADDQAQLRAAASLYLAAELEEAGLIPAVELAAGLWMSGGLSVDLGAAGPRLAAFWQARQRRFSASEREAIFARLFGRTTGPTLAAPGGQNGSFELLLIDLAEALYRLQPATFAYPGELPVSQEGLSAVARQLAANLVPRSGGMAAFASREMFQTIEQALAILKIEQVQNALGANSVWGAVYKVNSTYRRVQVDIAARVTRGKSGMTMLAWLATALPRLDGFGVQLVPPGHPVLGAAAAWLQASLSVHPEPDSAP